MVNTKSDSMMPSLIDARTMKGMSVWSAPVWGCTAELMNAPKSGSIRGLSIKTPREYHHQIGDRPRTQGGVHSGLMLPRGHGAMPAEPWGEDPGPCYRGQYEPRPPRQIGAGRSPARAHSSPGKEQEGDRRRRDGDPEAPPHAQLQREGSVAPLAVFFELVELRE